MMKAKKCLTNDIHGRIYMSYAARRPYPKGRINLARTLLQQYPHWPEAVQRLARNCSISERQAYRYLEQAQRLKHPVPVGDVKVSFTVKLSRRLVQRLRDYAASTGLTLSEIASRAFSAVLHRGGGRG
jgi:hypothetical protein